MNTLSVSNPPETFEIGEESFLLNGKPVVLRVGEIHAARIPREYWRHRLQLCKAMGLNAVCAYLFWNYHELTPGRFTWEGDADMAEFCRIAQEEGLYVLLRPGPYSCAEWEMGGLPWWLLKNSKIEFRSQDPAYLEPAIRYLREVGKHLAPLQVTHGGPILMVQVENEYAGNDTVYMGKLRQTLIDAGFDVPLFACNPPGNLKNSYRPDLFAVANFGSNPAGAFKTLRDLQPKGPLMCGEYYPAWFDMWGVIHHTKPAEPILDDLETMLKMKASFSLYMVHGGTSFGFWSGADWPFKPDTSSYDYDAPISEAGWVTEKFFKIRDLFARHLNPCETIPAPGAPNPVIEIPPFALTESASLLENLPAPVPDQRPRNMEMYDQSRGCIVYRTELPAGPAGALAVRDVNDFAWYYLDGEECGRTDRRFPKQRVSLPARDKAVTLTILVEAMGRLNFGDGVNDPKGIRTPVSFIAKDTQEEKELLGWDVYNLPFDESALAKVNFKPGKVAGPAYWRGQVKIEQVGDTFLNVRSWGKGLLWVNGHCLGRFWNIGPTQTMYCPAPWLKKGDNEIVIADLLGPTEPVVAGLLKPVLDELRLELDALRPQRITGEFKADASAVFEGVLAQGPAPQGFPFEAPATGRYLCFESLNAHDGKPFAALSELNALNVLGQVIDRNDWRVLWVDSEEIERADGLADNTLNGQSASFWISVWSEGQPEHPHRLIIDMGSSRELHGVHLLPRQGTDNVTGRVKDFRIYVSNQPFGFQV